MCPLGLCESSKIASLLHIEPIDRPLQHQAVMLLVEIFAVLLLELYLTFENKFFKLQRWVHRLTVIL